MNSINVPLIAAICVVIAALCTAGGTILGIIISSVIQSRTDRLNREMEERKHYKEIVVKAAIENWKEILAVAKARGATVFPLDSFLVASAAMADVIFDPTTNESNLAERLDKANELVRIAERSATERTERFRREGNKETPETTKPKRQG